MGASNPTIEKPDLWVARTEPDGSLLGRNELLDRSGHEFAPANVGVCVGPIAAERDGGLVFGNGLVIPVLRAQHLTLGEMHKRASRRCGRGSLSQLFGAQNIGGGRVSHKVKSACGELNSKPALRRDGLSIERQRSLE